MIDGEGNYIIGILFGLLFGFSYGLLDNDSKYLKEIYSAVEHMFWSASVSLVLFFLSVSVSRSVLLENLNFLLLLGFIATAFAFLLYLRGVTRIKVETAGLISLLEPPVSSILFCWMFLGEPLQSNMIGGCVFILARAVMIGYNSHI